MVDAACPQIGPSASAAQGLSFGHEARPPFARVPRSEVSTWQSSTTASSGSLFVALRGPDAYPFAERDGIELHLTQVDDLKPPRSMSAVHLRLEDTDALCREWSQAGIDRRLVPTAD
ncbi:MAG: hypothetical protein OER43_19075 [Gammaproteobacteria bacterium]|nr:hypothetical protein [Gammaproteobacteria bacterium]